MTIPDKQIKEYQKSRKEDDGVSLSYEESFEELNNLVGFFSLLLKIDRRKKEKVKK